MTTNKAALTAADAASAVRRGRADFRRRKSRDAVPYRDRERAELWERGWNYEQKKGVGK